MCSPDTAVEAPSEELARFAARLRWVDIPEHTQERVRAILLDAIASALVGHSAADSPRIIALARAVGGEGDATVIGGSRLSLGGATMANGFLITSQMLCDVHRPTLCHVSPEVVAPALAIAERENASGSDLLTAIAVGLEVCTRVGLGMNYPVFRGRGWHSPGITGPFGGAAAVGKVLGLDADGMTRAFSLAGSQSGGTFAQLGTPALKFQQARGALSGLLAALLSAEGLAAEPDILTHHDGGLYRAFSDGGKPELATRGLGEDWELEQISLRAWPVGVHMLGTVDLLLELLAQHDFDADDVTMVELTYGPAAYRTHVRQDWSDTFAARMSAHWVAAVVLHDRRCWLDQFEPSRLADPKTSSFAAERVKLVEDPSVVGAESSVRAFMRDGSILSAQSPHPPGDVANPLTAAQLHEKLRAAAHSAGRGEEADDLVAQIQSLEAESNVKKFVQRLGAVSQSSAQEE